MIPHAPLWRALCFLTPGGSYIPAGLSFGKNSTQGQICPLGKKQRYVDFALWEKCPLGANCVLICRNCTYRSELMQMIQ